jgi:hypothetical protein
LRKIRASNSCPRRKSQSRMSFSRCLSSWSSSKSPWLHDPAIGTNEEDRQELSVRRQGRSSCGGECRRQLRPGDGERGRRGESGSEAESEPSSIRNSARCRAPQTTPGCCRDPTRRPTSRPPRQPQRPIARRGGPRALARGWSSSEHRCRHDAGLASRWRVGVPASDRREGDKRRIIKRDTG